MAVLNANASQLDVWALGGIMSSLVYDWQMRRRIAGTNVNKCFVMESAVPRREALSSRLALLASSVSSPSWLVADQWLRIRNEIPTIAATAVKALWAICSARRTEMLAMLEAATAILYGVDEDIYRLILEDCDWPLEHLIKGGRSLNPVGFWRVDKKKYPEHRHTILSLVAFRDLQEKINECGGDTAAGIEAFCNQNDGQGWMLPETLRLADYGLGHDDRAQEHQPVRECFGPRFYDWQLAQTPEESWRECHLHARNLLGEAGYQRLIDEIEGRGGEDGKDDDDKDDDDKNDRASTDGKLFEKEHLPLFDR